MIPDASLDPPHSPARRMAELLIPLLLLVWRIVAVSPLRLATDLVAVLSAWWIYTLFAERTRAWRVVTGMLFFYLLALYASRQLPAVLLRYGLESP